MKLLYTKDVYGKDILQNEEGNCQVMMEWEKPYMEECIDKIEPRGSVLEIGFGFGYSARALCNNPNITEYTVIECSPNVWDKVEEFKKEYPHILIHLVKGRWQDVLQLCKKYDTIFFDDYGTINLLDFNRFNIFLYEVLKEHTNIGCKIGNYSTTNMIPDKISSSDCISCKMFELNINIPENCKYMSGNKMFMPLIEKKRQLDDKVDVELINYLKSKTININTNMGPVSLKLTDTCSRTGGG